MSRSILNKRIKEAESKFQRGRAARTEVEARAVTPERFNELMLALDAARREGDAGVEKFFKTLSGGELLACQRRRGEWASEHSKLITPEDIERLQANGIGMEFWTESELYAVAGDDGTDYDRLPSEVLDLIVKDPNAVDWDDLARRYPRKKR
ncbi:MAG: hypothetical protein P4L44_16580 [Oryzomonas sp.]|uniref:hypothetical protein n=1 Tax=Oryzomonas sp. TaxID=2855186 RepID=UPI00283BF5B0|nr:hypothetical protein [Oryzomonas sp.]MDR3581579.1 hypothetical protein [Oryzomonas sp.]